MLTPTLDDFAPAQQSSQLDSLSKRLSYILNYLQISQAELARQIGVKPQVIQYLCKSNVQKSKFIYPISECLDINPEWLMTGNGNMLRKAYQSYNEINYSKIPIIGWPESPYFQYQDSDITGYISTDHHQANSLIALRVNDKSMYPRFDLGTILVVDCSKVSYLKGFVLAYVKNFDTTIFRQIESHRNGHVLSPINKEMYKELIITANDTILGSVVEARWKV